MHPRVREIVDQEFFLRRTVEEVASLLPADDGDLDAWFSEAIALRDPMLVIFLVVAAMHTERMVASGHLGRGLHLILDPHFLCMFVWKSQGGDVPEQILHALKNTAIHPSNQAALLFTAAEWCKEHRDGAFPQELLTEARLLARQTKDLESKAIGYLISLGAAIDDQRILDLVIPPAPTAEKREELIQAGCTLGNIFLGVLKKPVGKLLREEAPRKLSGFTVRRSVEHIGRNEPCPCGSGRKYKRCCFEKDAERLGHSSDIAGKTQAEILAAPEQHLDADRLRKAQPYELCRIDPLKIDDDLLGLYLARLCAYKLWEEVVAGFEAVGWSEDSDPTWLFAVYRITREGRKDLVERMLAVRRLVEDPPYKEPPPDYVRLLLVRDDPAAFLQVLSEIATDVVAADHFIATYEIATGLLYSPFPALGILVARGFIPYAEKKFAVEVLDELLIAREKLNLSANEPASDLLDKRFANEEIAHGAKETEKLREARRALKTKADEVRRMQANLEKLRAEVERRETKEKEKEQQAAASKPAPPAPADAETLRELREKVATLKSALKERHAERATLRRDLSKTLTDLETLRCTKSQSAESTRQHEDAEDGLLLPGDIDGNQPLRTIELPKKFHHTLHHLPRHVGRSAMILLGRLAAGEPDAFIGVVRLKQRPDTMRARIGIDHRLLFRLDAEAVHVVDLIPRQDLERRIKTL